MQEVFLTGDKPLVFWKTVIARTLEEKNVYFRHEILAHVFVQNILWSILQIFYIHNFSKNL
jgi:hypothetical protein